MKIREAAGGESGRERADLYRMFLGRKSRRRPQAHWALERRTDFRLDMETEPGTLLTMRRAKAIAIFRVSFRMDPTLMQPGGRSRMPVYPKKDL